MNCFVRMTVLFIISIFCFHYEKTAAQIHDNSPWASTRTAESFLEFFMSAISRSLSFTNQQIGDMSAIADSILSTMEIMARSGKSSTSILQALNVAFASSVADIAVTEVGGSSTNEKTNAITDALAEAFLQTTGSVNSQFIEEIRRLVNMFAEASANNVLSTEEPKSSLANLSGIDALLQGTKIETGSEAASEESVHLQPYYGLKEVELSRDGSGIRSNAQSLDGSKQVASRDSLIESHYRHDNKMSGEKVQSSYKPEAAEKSGSGSSRQNAAYLNPEREASSAYNDALGSSFGSQTSGVRSPRSEFKTEKVGDKVPSLSAMLNRLQPDYGTSGGVYPFPETRPISTAPSGSAEPYYETSKKLPNFLDKGSLFQGTRIYNSGTAANSAVVSSTNTPERPDNRKNTRPQKLKYYQQNPDSFRLEIEGNLAAANTTKSSIEHKYETRESGSRPQESESYTKNRNKVNSAVVATRTEQDNKYSGRGYTVQGPKVALTDAAIIVADYNTPESDFRNQGNYFEERGSWPQEHNIYAPEVSSRILKTGTAANNPIEPNNETLEKNTKPQKIDFLQERPRLFDEEATSNTESVATVVGNPEASEYAPLKIRYRSRGHESYDRASTSTVSTAAEKVARLDTDYDFLRKVYEKLRPVQEKPLYKSAVTASSASEVSGKSNLSGPRYTFSGKDDPLPIPDVTKKEPELYGQGTQNMQYLSESTYDLNKQRAEQKESASYSPGLRDQGISISERNRRRPEISAGQKYVPRPKMDVIIDASSTRSSAKDSLSKELRYRSQRPESYDIPTGSTNAASTVEVDVPIGSSEKNALSERPEIRYERPQTYNPRANYSRYINTADTAAAIGDLLRSKYISKKTEVPPLGFESYGSRDAANTLEGAYAVGSLLKPVYRTPTENYEIQRESIDRPKYAARGTAGATLTPDNQFKERDVVSAEARDEKQRPIIYESQMTKNAAVVDTAKDDTIKPYYVTNMPRGTLGQKNPTTYGQNNLDGVTATVDAVSGSLESNFRSEERDVVPHELKNWQPRSETNGAEAMGRDSFKATVANGSIRNGLKQPAAGHIKPMSDGPEKVNLASYFPLDSDDKPLGRDNRPEKTVIYGHKAIGSATGIVTTRSGSDYNYDKHAINAQSPEQYSSRQIANVGTTVGASLKLDYGYPGIDYPSKLPKIDGLGSVNQMTAMPSEDDSYLLSNFQPSQRYANSERRRTYAPEATSNTKISTTATSEDAPSKLYHVPEKPRLRYSGSKTIYEPKKYWPQDSGLYDISTANSASSAEHNLTNFTAITKFRASEPKARAQEPSADRPEVLTSSAETAYIKTRPTIYSYSPRRGETEFQLPKMMSDNSETKTDNKETTEAVGYPSEPIYGRTGAKPRLQWTEYGPHEPGDQPHKSVLDYDGLESYETESDRAGAGMESGWEKPYSSRAVPVDRESAEESSDGVARNLQENVKIYGLAFETDSDDINLTSKPEQQLSSLKSFSNSHSGFKSSYLYDVINDLFNSALKSNPGLSDCEILVQVLLDVITAIEI